MPLAYWSVWSVPTVLYEVDFVRKPTVVANHELEKGKERIWTIILHCSIFMHTFSRLIAVFVAYLFEQKYMHLITLRLTVPAKEKIESSGIQRIRLINRTNLK